MFKRENSADVISWNIYIWCRHVSWHLWTDLFQTWYGTKHYYSLQFDSSLNDLDVLSRSQGYEKARSCAVILFVKFHEAAEMLVMVDYVREITLKNSCK